MARPLPTGARTPEARTDSSRELAPERTVVVPAVRPTHIPIPRRTRTLLAALTFTRFPPAQERLGRPSVRYRHRYGRSRHIRTRSLIRVLTTVARSQARSRILITVMRPLHGRNC